MRKTLIAIFCLSVALFMYSCGAGNNKRTKTIQSEYDYQSMYKDSFDILLHSETPPYTLADTLYTEMYIALKTSGKDPSHLSEKSCNIVIDRVDRLMEIDSFPENQRQYLEAKKIVLSKQKRYDEWRNVDYQYWNTYPENSLERLSSLSCHFLSLQETDSANFYLEKTIKVAESFQNDIISDKRLQGITLKVNSLIYLNRDSEAIDYLKERIKVEGEKQIKDILQEMLDDFDSYKQATMSLIKNNS